MPAALPQAPRPAHGRRSGARQGSGSGNGAGPGKDQHPSMALGRSRRCALVASRDRSGDGVIGANTQCVAFRLIKEGRCRTWLSAQGATWQAGDRHDRWQRKTAKPSFWEDLSASRLLIVAADIALVCAAKLRQSSELARSDRRLCGSGCWGDGSTFAPSRSPARAVVVVWKTCRVPAGCAAESACITAFNSGYISIEANLLIRRLVANECQRISVS